MSKSTAFASGLVAESVAKIALRLGGFSILAQRFSCPAGEIDLVARRGNLLIFVEVKRRADLATALSALDRRQQRRIARAAEIYLRDHPAYRDLPCRFDLVAISPWMVPRHVKDIWRR